MTPFEWAMMIMAALSTATAATSGTDIDNETAAQLPGGGGGSDSVGIGGLLAGLQNPLQTPAIPGGLEGPTAAAAAAAGGTPQTTVTTPPEIPTPDGTSKTGADGKADIGQILASIPEALNAIAPLLGLTDDPRVPQRPAPIAGGQAGGPVGQFAQPFGQGGVNIAQLLQALPGIGR